MKKEGIMCYLRNITSRKVWANPFSLWVRIQVSSFFYPENLFQGHNWKSSSYYSTPGPDSLVRDHKSQLELVFSQKFRGQSVNMNASQLFMEICSNKLIIIWTYKLKMHSIHLAYHTSYTIYERVSVILPLIVWLAGVWNSQLMPSISYYLSLKWLKSKIWSTVSTEWTSLWYCQKIEMP